ncbi:MAG: sigma 54-interacting transcriptional regulator [Terriglobia bacterium]
MTNIANVVAQGGIDSASLVGPVVLSAASPTGEIRTWVVRMARADLPVLLVGESETDKDAVARLIHRLSSRAQHVLARLDCSSLTDDALEIELFGFESPAAFNGGRPKRGILELCHRGTVLLENFTEMPSRLQARLLDLLDDGYLCRMGGQERVRVDVRIIASTPLARDQALAAGKLRTDLYYRLNTLTLELPLEREPGDAARAPASGQDDFEGFVRRSLLTGGDILPLSGVQGKGGKARGTMLSGNRCAL